MQKVTLIPGDGIGQEIAASMVDIFAAAKVPLEWEQADAGIGCLEQKGKLIEDSLFESISRNKIAIKGPTTTPIGGGHRSVNVYLRQHYQLYANLRPIKNIEGVPSVQPEVDMLIVRENTEDLYAGIEYMIGDEVAHGIKLITKAASLRVGRFALDLAQRLGRKKVTIVHKANIMKLSDGLFLNTIRGLQPEFPDIEINDCIVDNFCMQAVTKPQQFDVVVTENLYGDIISDLCSGLVGGLGVASGANFGEGIAIFEPVHGSAPDICGQDKANPTAMLFSAIDMLRYLKLNDHARIVDNALRSALKDPQARTGDLGGPLGTKAFTQAVIQQIG